VYELPQGRFANALTLELLDEAAMQVKLYIDSQLAFALELLGWASDDDTGVSE
jgi:hypothetical protein